MKFTKIIKFIIYLLCDSFFTFWRYYRTLFKSSVISEDSESSHSERRNENDD